MIEKIKNFVDLGVENFIKFTPKVLLSILIIWIGVKIIKKIDGYINTFLVKIGLSDTIRPFIISIINFLYYALLFFIVMHIVGIDISLFASIVAASVFAIGMSLQGSLSNFASGLLILSLKPYKANDFIQIDDKFGKIDKIDMFSTLVTTPGNKSIIIPNSKLTSEIVTNYSNKGHILLDLEVSIPYAEDFPKIKSLLEEVLNNIPEVLNDPKPEVGIKSFESHSIILAIWPRINPKDYWSATFKVNSAIKKTFHDNNVKVAYSEGIELGDIGA